MWLVCVCFGSRVGIIKCPGYVDDERDVIVDVRRGLIYTRGGEGVEPTVPRAEKSCPHFVAVGRSDL